MCRSIGYGFCFSESGTGSTNQRFCLEQGIVFAIPTLEHGRGDHFAARIAVQTNVVAVPARVPLHVHSNTPIRLEGQPRLTFFSLEQGIYSHDFVWNRVAELRLFSLEQGQVFRHSAAHPHPKLRGLYT